MTQNDLVRPELDLIKLFKETMGESNLKNICNEDEKKMEDDKKKFKSIYRRYYKRLEELNQEVAINELFLFSILTGRINTGKALCKRGKVRSFKLCYIILKLIFYLEPNIFGFISCKNTQKIC